MDVLTIFHDISPQDDGTSYIYFQVLINDNLRITPVVDLYALCESARLSGTYEVFTCGCGAAGCDGLVGIEVTHHDEVIDWTVRRPLSWHEFKKLNLSEYSYDNFRFEKDQYLGEIRDQLGKVNNIVSSWRTDRKLCVWPDTLAEGLTGITL